jgi:hypothetical protein
MATVTSSVVWGRVYAEFCPLDTMFVLLLLPCQSRVPLLDLLSGQEDCITKPYARALR